MQSYYGHSTCHISHPHVAHSYQGAHVPVMNERHQRSINITAMFVWERTEAQCIVDTKSLSYQVYKLRLSGLVLRQLINKEMPVKALFKPQSSHYILYHVVNVPVLSHPYVS